MEKTDATAICDVSKHMPNQLRIEMKCSKMIDVNISFYYHAIYTVTVSQAFKNGKFFHASSNLVAYFNSNFPLPQGKSWTEFTLPSKLVLL